MYKFALQRKEAYAMPNILGNRSFPVHTHRWRDIALSDDKDELVKLIPSQCSANYRIDERPTNN